MEEAQPAIKLEIDDKLKDVMEERLILVEDIRKVIDYAEKTGNKFYNQETGILWPVTGRSA